jgi:hypothetical protein
VFSSGFGIRLDLSTSASQITGTAVRCHHVQLVFFFLKRVTHCINFNPEDQNGLPTTGILDLSSK